MSRGTWGAAAMRALTLLTGAMLAGSGCATQHRMSPADTPLQQAVRFVETDGRGRHYDLSGTDQDGDALLDGAAAATRVADPGLVGMESTLLIRVDPLRMVAGQNEFSPQFARDLSTLDNEAAQLREAVAGLRALAVQETELARKFVELQGERMSAGDRPMPTTAWSEWKAALRAFSAAEDDLISTLMKWEASDPEFYARLDAAGSSTNDIVSLLQDRLDFLSGEHANLAAALKARSLSLTLEAWWLGDDQRGQLHLPHYDDLDAGDVVRRDRAGLDLGADDRARLEEHWQATVALAGALEDYHQGRGALRDAVAAAAPALADLANELQAFHDSLVSIDMPAARRETLAALNGCLRAQGRAILTANALLVDKWGQRVDAVTSWLSAAAEHADSWRSLPPAEALAQIDAARTLGQQGAALLRATRVDVAAAGTTALPAVLSALAGVDQVPGTTAACWTNSAFAENTVLGRLWLRAERLLALASDVYSDLSRVRPLPPLETDAWRVPVESARSTSLDLTRSPHKPGDRVVVRARLWRGEAKQPEDEVVATFIPQWFGWHGRLSPAVVLARPDRLPNGLTPQYGFAPVLSWLHAYTPRPEQRGAVAGLARALEPALGIHATFLNVDPDSEVEVGLGATLAMWGDRLQIGGGFNLMAADEASGRYYGFVGSDLIALLNSAGLGAKP